MRHEEAQFFILLHQLRRLAMLLVSLAFVLWCPADLSLIRLVLFFGIGLGVVNVVSEVIVIVGFRIWVKRYGGDTDVS